MYERSVLKAEISMHLHTKPGWVRAVVTGARNGIYPFKGAVWNTLGFLSENIMQILIPCRYTKYMQAYIPDILLNGTPNVKILLQIAC